MVVGQYATCHGYKGDDKTREGEIVKVKGEGNDRYITLRTPDGGYKTLYVAMVPDMKLEWRN